MIYIITGPSGVGKNTIINELSNHLDFYFSVSHTTRPRRENEVDGKDYYFVTEDEFENLIKRDQFLKSFSASEISINDIVNASKDINLQSIRVHKFLTSTGEMGKVATAKFLDSIDLTENTKLIELNNRQIDAIIEYVKT